MEESIRYILSFLCRSEELADMVGYTSDKSKWGKYKVIILPSGFFTAGEYLQPSSMPAAPLKKLNGTPILFGSPVIRRDKQTIIEADLIASAYFILCRYEECVNPRRDYLGRFLAEHSRISQSRIEELMLNPTELVKDVGTLLEGRDAVREGLIDEVGGLGDALHKLHEMIREEREKKCKNM